MNHKRSNIPSISIWSVISGLVIAILLLAGFWAAVLLLRQPDAAPKLGSPIITVVPAPTFTPVITMPAPAASATPVGDQGQARIPDPNNALSVGTYVQITGTGGSGLRIRSQPGTSSPQLYLGMENEVYLIQDGPKQKDGFTWYYLVAPYDKNRSGWAASNYLKTIQKPSS